MGLTASGGLAVVVLDTLAASADDDSLALLLGAVAAGALRTQLRRDARRWAAATAGADGPGAFEASSVAAALAALSSHTGPVAFVAPDVPGLDAALTQALLSDLDDGVGVTFGPTFDGSPYLLATSTPDPELLALAAGHRDELFAAVAERGIAIGLLRSQRRLAGATDARALAADPATPLELGALLAAGLDVRARR